MSELLITQKPKVPSETPEERGRRILAALPAAVREKLLAQPKVLEDEIELRKRLYPSKDWIPNIGQERALKPLLKKHETYGDYPYNMFVTGGNGSGKTNVLSAIFAGITLGPNFLHPFWLAGHQFFHDVMEIRRTRKFYVRIICDAADVTESGSVYQQISKMVPSAEFTNKEGNHFTRIRVPNPDPQKYYEVVVDIKTHGQPVTASAGPDIDLLLFNEPAPLETYQENMSRLRLGGRAMSFFTPLHLAGYAWKIIKGEYPAGEVAHVELSIWDNCKDIEGNRGFLSKENIERQIRAWKITKPLELEARVNGKFTFLAGAVFPLFRRNIHVVAPEPLKGNENFYMAVDPHPAKPHVAVWVAVDPTNVVKIIACYPSEPWEFLPRSPLGISQFGSEFRRIESGLHPAFPFGKRIYISDRIGDPNAMKCENSRTRTSMATDYADLCDMTFNLDVPDSVALRHDRITESLYYNWTEALSATNRPSLVVYDWCHNIVSAFEQYMFKSIERQGTGAGFSDKVEEQWECFIACIGYLLLTIPAWSPIKLNGLGDAEGQDDYLEYRKGVTGFEREAYAEQHGDMSVLCKM